MSARFYHSLFILVIACCLNMAGSAYGKKIVNSRCKFSVTVPDGMKRIPDSNATSFDEVYHDTTCNIVLLVSVRKSQFHSVRDYIDCSKDQLETQLKDFYSDPALTLISCNRSEYYPKKTTAILIGVSVLPYGFNTCMVYFIHHKKNDIQLSFTYKKEATPQIAQYVATIMSSLELK